MNTPHLIYTFYDPLIVAASGLALVNECFYLVADDELAMLVLPQTLTEKPRLLEVFKGILPENPKERKKIKPDFEALLYLPLRQSFLCLPSGSKVNRTRAALVTLEGKVTELSFKNVYSELEAHFPELNIEGAVLVGDKIRLFQRGNGKLHQNAMIELRLDAFLEDKITELKLIKVDLGKLGNVPLSFTDAFLYQDHCWFLAVAEATESTFDDGEFIGAVLGRISHAGKIEQQAELNIKSKPEGLVIQNGKYYLVSDDDDRSKPSKLFSGTLLVN